MTEYETVWCCDWLEQHTKSSAFSDEFRERLKNIISKAKKYESIKNALEN